MHLFWSWSIYCTHLPYSCRFWEIFFFNVKGFHYQGYLHAKQYSWNNCWDDVGITHVTFGTVMLRVTRCFNISLNTSVWWEYFQPNRKVKMSHLFISTSLKAHNSSTIPSVPSDSQYLCIDLVNVRIDRDRFNYTVNCLYIVTVMICKQFLYNSYKRYFVQEINASIMNEL